MTEEIVTSVISERSVIDMSPPQPVFGDVLDSLDDAVASMRVVARNETEALVNRIRGGIRAKPLKVVTLVAAAAYLLGRLAR
jgi:hypothetical protein